MKIVDVHEAKAKLSELLREALAGEEIVIARRNQPLVRLAVLAGIHPERRLGTAAGLITMADDFDETPAEFADSIG